MKCGARSSTNALNSDNKKSLEDPNNPASRRVLLIDKNKDGPLAKVYLSFDPEYMRFSDGRKPEQAKFEELQDDGEPIPF